MNILNALNEFKMAGNDVFHIIGLFAIILAAYIAGKILRVILQKTAAKFEGQNRDVLAATLNAGNRGIVFFLLSWGISLGLSFLKLSPAVLAVANTASAVILTLGVGYLLYWLVDVPIAWLAKITQKSGNIIDDMILPIVRKTLRITLVILILVQIAQILSDKPITSIIAGLGIGGLAIALAAQDSIKNFFGSIVLSLDKPFAVGERVVIDSHDGVIEDIGLRSTRIRTLDGHLVTMPNGELANKAIKNIAKRPYIKRIANITITYDTPPEKIDRAIEIIKELLDNHEGMKEDFPAKVYFSEFNADSLNILVIYWYHPPDYWMYMDFTEKFNKELFRRFKEEGIDFAFPTRTVYLAGDATRPLKIGIEN